MPCSVGKFTKYIEAHFVKPSWQKRGTIYQKTLNKVIRISARFERPNFNSAYDQVLHFEVNGVFGPPY